MYNSRAGIGNYSVLQIYDSIKWLNLLSVIMLSRVHRSLLGGGGSMGYCKTKISCISTNNALPVNGYIILTMRLQLTVSPFAFASIFFFSFSSTRRRKSRRQFECFTCSMRTLILFAMILPLYATNHLLLNWLDVPVSCNVILDITLDYLSRNFLYSF